MFTLFALLHDADGRIDHAALLRDFQQTFPFASEYTILSETQVFPATERVVLEKAGWRVRLTIRKQGSMSLSLPALQKILRPKAALPAHFLAYDTEIAIGFGDDPEDAHTNDILHIGEFVRENFSGVLIYDQYNQALW